MTKHRLATIGRWSRNGDASFPLSSFNWRDNISREIATVAQKFLDSVDLEFSLANGCSVAHMGDRLGEISGEVRISARHIHYIVLSKRAHLITG